MILFSLVGRGETTSLFWMSPVSYTFYQAIPSQITTMQSLPKPANCNSGFFVDHCIIGIEELICGT